ncbi:hypothetical protein [Halomarina ordinaria]|uniref:Uncharacterized protein n=1 Tax=Halomarina ordinaria TaxID=3033939 RepID=A0ABD5U4V9_9EURY|nr:hypothetical protein [Halomarina sp. PSRA2]
MVGTDGEGGSLGTRRRFVALVGVGLGAALAGCTGDGNSSPEEATVTVRLRNRDDTERAYRVVVRRGESATNEFSGRLPARSNDDVEMVATFRPAGDRAEVSVETDAAQRGQTWDPTECRDYLVEAFVEDGEPELDGGCRDD